MLFVYTYDFYIAAKPEEVWQTLVSDEAVKQIFYGCTIQSTFQVGDRL